MHCERHGAAIVETDLVVTRLGPNRTAVMAALRGPMLLSPAGVGELVRKGTPIVVGQTGPWLGAWEEHLGKCGATTERWQRVFCELEDLTGATA